MKSWRLPLAVGVIFALLLIAANNMFPDEAYAAWTRLRPHDRQNGIAHPAAIAYRSPRSPGLRSIVLPSTEAGAIMHLCSRPAPKVEGTWEATEADIEGLEATLQEISMLRSTVGIKSVRIADPQSFSRQYVAIVVGGRRLIYVNAFYSIDPLPFAAEQLVNVCDGGPYFWGVVFDPSTGRYSDLRMNGRA